MAEDFQKRRIRPKTWVMIIWSLMLAGPFSFFLLLSFFGLQPMLNGPYWLDFLDDNSTPVLDYVIDALIALVILPEIIGLVVAKAKRGALAGTPFESHAISASRTYWIALAGAVMAFCLPLLVFGRLGEIAGPLAGVGVFFVVLGFLILLAVWKTARVVRGLRRAIGGKSIADEPTRWS